MSLIRLERILFKEDVLLICTRAVITLKLNGDLKGAEELFCFYIKAF